jgi:uncharacterized protein with PQ loop repeat
LGGCPDHRRVCAQLLRSWRTGGKELSWMMLALFGSGVGLWFVYGFLRASGPLMLANGLTGLQVLCLIAVKAAHLRASS